MGELYRYPPYQVGKDTKIDALVRIKITNIPSQSKQVLDSINKNMHPLCMIAFSY
jgi:hypothetical protein